MKVLSLFSGIGAFEKALDRLNIDYELVAFSEIDKYATKSYCAIHGVDESMNLGDITKVDENSLPKDIDLITYGFPCQDISLAGKQKGLFNNDRTQTRSGLFFEALRIIETTKPKIAIAENVKNLTGKKFKEQFELVLGSLEEAGYSNYWKVLNAKDYGIPQNRERVFIISIRKDIDKGYEFPEGFPLELRLKDMLEDEVEEKYYIDSEKVNQFIVNNPSIDTSKAEKVGNIYLLGGQNGNVYSTDGLSPTLSHSNSNGNKSQVVLSDKNDLINPVCLNSKAGRGGIDGLQPSVQDRVYDSEAISTAVTTSYMPSVLVREATKKGYAEAVEGDSVNIGQPNSKTRRGRVGKQVSQTLTTSGGNEMAVVVDEVKRIVSATRKCDIGVTVHDNGDIRPRRLDKKKSGISEMQINKDTNISNTVTASHMPKTYGDSTNFRIRKLTPKECWRLMGFDDEDFYKAEAVNSNAQLYKQAGNSIVVDVIVKIYEKLFERYGDVIK